jgi:hypothetical protein
MAETPDTWYQQISITFSDGTEEILHIERRETGTHVPTKRVKPEPWVMLPFHKCPSCPLTAGIACCPAAQSLQTTMSKLRSRTSTERVKATVVDAEGREQSMETDLQNVGAVLVRLAVFESACPIGYEFKPKIQGLPPFVESMELIRHVMAKILEKHDGSVEAAREEAMRIVEPLREVFIHLVARLRNDPNKVQPVKDGTGKPVIADAAFNSIITVDAISQRFQFNADRLLGEISSELGWK